jgi:hypothetical protein
MAHTRPALPILLFIVAACQPSIRPTPVPPTEISLPTQPATPSATASPVAPTETLTPAPAPRDFTEDFNASPPHWQFLQVDNGQPPIEPVVQSGFLVFHLPAANQWVYGLYGPQDYSDVRVDASVETRAGDHGSTGVICRYSEQNGWYEFNVYANQTYVLLYAKWLTKGVARYTTLVRAASEKIQPVQNEIGLLCQGKTLTPFINGVQLRQNPENTFGLASGQVGISAASFDVAPVTIAYDWAKVSEP